jgi:hypothetical protein
MRRLAELSDLEPVFAIYMDATVVPFLGYDPMPIEAFQPIFRELVESRCFFVYEVSGELAGFYKAVATSRAGEPRRLPGLTGGRPKISGARRGSRHGHAGYRGASHRRGQAGRIDRRV